MTRKSHEQTNGFVLTRNRAQDFRHREHVEAAFRLLKRAPFLDAAACYANGLRELAQEAGAPEKFNLTITIAFLSSIAERLAADPDADWETFITKNSELLDKHLLRRWYAPDRLRGQAAREHFLMPSAR